MILSTLIRAALSSCAFALLLAGCGAQGAAPVTPAQGAVPFALRQAQDDTLYVVVGTTAYMYNYPSLKSAGEVTQQPFLGPLGGSDPINGEMCFDDGQNDVYVYSHSGQLLNTINPPNYGNYVSSTDCAFDPTTNDLAVTAAQFFSDRTAKYYYVAVYSTASGEPKIFKDPKLGQIYDAVYDSSGDLFVDGCCNGSNAYILGELPKGEKKFVEISLPQSLEQSFAWQDLDWDGKYVAVVRWTLGFQMEIDRLSFSKGSATIVGTTILADARPRQDSEQFTIAGDRVIGPLRKDRFAKVAPLGIWDYPAGGTVSRTLHIHLDGSKRIGAVVVSSGGTP